MNKLAFGLPTALTALALISSASPAQAPVAGPEYVGVFEANVNSAARSLERQPIMSRVKSGLMSARITEEVAGDRSPVRFASGQQVQFTVRVASQDNDPQTTIQFFVMTPRKGRRALLAMKAGYGSMKQTGDRQAVAFEARRHGTQFFRIAPLAPLAPGEYMLRLTPQGTGFNYQPGDGFLFGID